MTKLYFCEKLQRICFIPILLLLIAGHVLAAECDMNPAFSQTDMDAKGGVTSVWSDAQTSSLLFVSSLNVNTDGTRRSYSVEDFWGEKSALNNVCNAMSDACDNLSKEEKRDRRILTQQANNEDWPHELLKQTKLSPNIIPMVHGKPCPLVDGFLVSATELQKLNIKDVCDINNYVDSLTTSAIVIPRTRWKEIANTKKLVEIPNEFSKRNAKVGDLVVAMVPGSDKPFFAVIGDTGPVNELGEASIALNGRLLGKTSLPENYDHVRGRDRYKGQGWEVPDAVVLIFPSAKK